MPMRHVQAPFPACSQECSTAGHTLHPTPSTGLALPCVICRCFSRRLFGSAGLLDPCLRPFHLLDLPCHAQAPLPASTLECWTASLRPSRPTARWPSTTGSAPTLPAWAGGCRAAFCGCPSPLESNTPLPVALTSGICPVTQAGSSQLRCMHVKMAVLSSAHSIFNVPPALVSLLQLEYNYVLGSGAGQACYCLSGSSA